jgi:hypothetical protein
VRRVVLILVGEAEAAEGRGLEPIPQRWIELPVAGHEAALVACMYRLVLAQVGVADDDVVVNEQQ